MTAIDPAIIAESDQAFAEANEALDRLIAALAGDMAEHPQGHPQLSWVTFCDTVRRHNRQAPNLVAEICALAIQRLATQR